MASLAGYFKSSVGRKFIMGLTGLALSGFVLTHMAGNLLMFVSPEAYNRYGHTLTSNPLIYIAEIGLIALFLVHLFCAITLTLENRAARGDQGYRASPSGAKASSLAARSMIYTGSIILVFTILHLITFKFGTYYSAVYDGVEMRDLHRLMVEVFESPIYVGWYIVSLLLLGVHLKHGVSSCFQSLGLSHPRYTPFIKCAGVLYAVIVTVGFIAQPVYIYLFLRS